MIVDFPILDLEFKYYPELIQYSHEMSLLSTLYEKAFYFNEVGEVKSNVLERFFWKDGKFTLKFKNNLLTSKGRKFGALDFYYSLKRLLVLNKNTHGRLKTFICPENNLKSIDDNCSGLFLNSDEVHFIVNKGQVKTLIELMSTSEFSIIPRESFDSKTLKIKNYQETTGAYSLSGIDQKEKTATLLVNTNYSSDITKSPKFIILKGHYNYKNKPDHDFQNSKVDIFPTFSSIDQYSTYTTGLENSFNIHKSIPINLLYIRFSPTSKLSVERRIALFKKIRSYYYKNYFQDNFHIATNQLFPKVGELSLSDKQIEEFKNRVNLIDDKKELGRGIIFGVQSDSAKIKLKKSLKKVLPHLRYKIKEGFFFEENDDIDFLVSSTDTGVHEHYSLLAYFASSKTFQFPSRKEEEKWFEEYAKEENKQLRLKMAKDKHFESLMNAYALPIYLSPYVALAKKPWKLDKIPKIYAGTPLWRIYRE